MSQKTVYTDGKRVTVTGLSLRVGGRLYPLHDITRYGFATVVPERRLAILMISIGIAIAAMGMLEAIPAYAYQWIPAVTIQGYAIPPGELVNGSGLALIGLGLLALIAVPVRYAVRITTGAGEMNVVVSRRKAYIKRIVDGLGKALRRHYSDSAEETFGMSANR